MFRMIKKGNILEYVDKNNNHTCYIWGYNYKYPIAEIQGATYDSVKSVLGHEIMIYPICKDMENIN